MSRPLSPPARPSEPPTPNTERPVAAVQTFFAVALQLGRTFPSLIELTRAIDQADSSSMHRAARVIAHSVLHGARDRGRGQHVRSAIDQQRRTASLTRLWPSRPGRTPQAVAARKSNKVAA
jgi:hypothetical protein